MLPSLNAAAFTWFSYNPLAYLSKTFEQSISEWMGGTLTSSLTTLNDNLIQRIPRMLNTALPSLGDEQEKVDAWEATFMRDVEAATKAKIALTLDQDGGQACKKAGLSHLLLQSQLLVNQLSDTQECLWGNDKQLWLLRATSNTEGGFKPKQTQFAEEGAVMYIPGIGVYRGWYDIVEYR